jgi:hypothetical protein
MTVSGLILDILGAPVLIWSELSNEASRIHSGAVIRGKLKARERIPVWIAEKIGSKAHRGNGCFAHLTMNTTMEPMGILKLVTVPSRRPSGPLGASDIRTSILNMKWARGCSQIYAEQNHP